MVYTQPTDAVFIFIFIIGYPCHRSVGPAGDSVNPHPNTPATEAGPRYWGGYLSRLDRIQWSAIVLVLTSTVAHIPLWRGSQRPKPHSSITSWRISLFPGIYHATHTLFFERKEKRKCTRLVLFAYLICSPYYSSSGTT